MCATPPVLSKLTGDGRIVIYLRANNKLIPNSPSPGAPGLLMMIGSGYSYMPLKIWGQEFPKTKCSKSSETDRT